MPRIKKDIPEYLKTHYRRNQILNIKEYEGFKVGDRISSTSYLRYGVTKILAFCYVDGDQNEVRAVVYYPSEPQQGYFDNGYFVLQHDYIKLETE